VEREEEGVRGLNRIGIKFFDFLINFFAGDKVFQQAEQTDSVWVRM
jgi:hypothetical protein